MHDLLALQALDTEADQLRHRMANLPERIEVDAAQRVEDETAESIATLDVQRHELGRQQKRFDDEISSITSHMEEVEATLYGGMDGKFWTHAGQPAPNHIRLAIRDLAPVENLAQGLPVHGWRRRDEAHLVQRC